MVKYFIVAIILFSSCQKDIALKTTPINAKGEILFISRRIANSAEWQMFLMNADGTNQRLLSNDLVFCTPPVLSHNGAKVAFTTYDNNGNRNLYIIDKNGQNSKLLATANEYCGNPAWSLDDSRIAFVKKDNIPSNDYNIYTINVDGTNEKKLTNQYNNFSPQFSPDNNSIIYTSSNNMWSGIYKMNKDGSNKTLLTPQGKSFGNPQISPDGNMLSITSGDWDGSQIFVMNSDGSNLKQLTFTVSPIYYDPGFPRDGNCNPVWSPTDSRLAYVSYENGSPDIFVINSNGSGNKRLTDTPLRDENPSWTKDGNYIIFSSNRKPNVAHQIYIMHPNGQLQTSLTNYLGDNIYPVFNNK